MANRSYLYSISNQPSSYYDRPDIANGLSEWSYAIPMTYRILMSGNPKLCESLLYHGYDHEEEREKTPFYALTSDFDIGFARLKKFFTSIEPLFLENGYDASKEIKEALEFLEQHKQPFLLLETIELDMMLTEGADNLRQAVEDEIQRCLLVGRGIDAIPDDKETAIEVIKWAASDPENLFSAINFNSECDYVDAGYPMGLSYWESSLYYRILNKKEFEEES